MEPSEPILSEEMRTPIVPRRLLEAEHGQLFWIEPGGRDYDTEDTQHGFWLGDNPSLIGLSENDVRRIFSKYKESEDYDAYSAEICEIAFSKGWLRMVYAGNGNIAVEGPEPTPDQLRKLEDFHFENKKSKPNAEVVWQRWVSSKYGPPTPKTLFGESLLTEAPDDAKIGTQHLSAGDPGSVAFGVRHGDMIWATGFHGGNFEFSGRLWELDEGKTAVSFWCSLEQAAKYWAYLEELYRSLKLDLTKAVFQHSGQFNQWTPYAEMMKIVQGVQNEAPVTEADELLPMPLTESGALPRGWLSPDGEFTPVEGVHWDFTIDYMKKTPRYSRNSDIKNKLKKVSALLQSQMSYDSEEIDSIGQGLEEYLVRDGWIRTTEDGIMLQTWDDSTASRVKDFLDNHSNELPPFVIDVDVVEPRKSFDLEWDGTEMKLVKDIRESTSATDKLETVIKAAGFNPDDWEQGNCFAFAQGLAKFVTELGGEAKYALLVGPDAYDNDSSTVRHVYILHDGKYYDANGATDKVGALTSWVGLTPDDGGRVEFWHEETAEDVAKAMKKYLPDTDWDDYHPASVEEVYSALVKANNPEATLSESIRFTKHITAHLICEETHRIESIHFVPGDEVDVQRDGDDMILPDGRWMSVPKDCYARRD